MEAVIEVLRGFTLLDWYAIGVVAMASYLACTLRPADLAIVPAAVIYVIVVSVLWPILLLYGAVVGSLLVLSGLKRN